MKKKTRSRSSSNLLGAFLTAIFVCLVGAAVSSYFFVNNYFQTLSKLDEDPIATISFKYKTAQRKFLGRTVWDRLKQQSNLYNGDTIHTADYSEATITFNDGNLMLLSESTMAQIFLKEDGSATADLQDGEAQVDASNSSNGFVLSYGGNGSLSVNSGSAANAKLEGAGGVKVQVLAGNAVIVDSNGKSHSVAEGEALGVDENGVKQPLIVVKSPAPNQKIVYHTEGDCEVDFLLKSENLPENSQMILEISDTKKFAKILSSEFINPSGFHSVKLPPKNYYWRIRLTQNNGASNTEDFTIGSKVSITQALAPNLVTPVQDFSASYRTKIPTIRFVWAEVPMSQSYRMCISRNKDMSNPLITSRVNSASAIISTLEAGNYYWQVTPYFAVNNEGYAAPSEIYSFKVEKKGDLKKAVLFVPNNDGIVNIDKSAKNTSFSWRMDEEAAKYTLKIADNPELANPVVKMESSENYLSVKTSNFLTEGRWYWGVDFEDFEGNLAPVSNANSFYALNGNPEQRIIEPANGYQVSENLLPDLRFTWKKNLPENFVSEFQIAADESFKRIIYRTSGSGYNINGLVLPIGTYYWRLHSVSEADNMVLDTPAKNFRVVGNLGATELLDPTSKAVARDNKPYTFKWKEVPEADFYKLEIFRVSTGEMVHSDNVYDTQTDIEMYYAEGFADKENYRIEIQPRSNGIPGISSRRVGKITETTFNLVKLKPVKIVEPELDQEINGAEAALNKIRITWDAVDNVRKAQVVVYRVLGEERIPVVKLPSDEDSTKVAPNTVYIDNPDLNNGGIFEIIVYAETLDGIDISNTDSNHVGRFNLSPVQPLPAATNLSASPKSLDADYITSLDNPRTASIKLRWSGVKDATEYKLTILQGKKELFTYTTKATSYDLPWVEAITAQKDEKIRDLLYKGTFTFRVEAIRRIDQDKDGILDTVLQGGLYAEGKFTTDVPKPKKAATKGAQNAYSTK